MEAQIWQFLERGGSLSLSNPALGGGEHGDIPARDGHCLFRTSGSGGTPKYVALSRRALLEAAGAVNRRFGVVAADRWLCALPAYHVGGFGIYARAFISGGRVDVLEGRWDAARFCREVADRGCSLTSLVPTQVFDLVAGGHRAAAMLRAVFVGGGGLNASVYSKSIELGWPLISTYGMTETCGMVAAAQGAEDYYRALDGWEIRAGVGGVLEVKGEGLFSGYVVPSAGGSYAFEEPKGGDGWFTTSDRVAMGGGGFRFLGRVSEEVKVLGELVDLARLQARVEGIAQGLGIDVRGLLVVALPDVRRGDEVVLAVARGVPPGMGEEIRRVMNLEVAGYERIGRCAEVERIPVGELGKPLRGELEAQLRGDVGR